MMNSNNTNVQSSPLLSKARYLGYTMCNENDERHFSSTFFFEEDDNNHIPNTQMESLQKELRCGLERERYWHVMWYDLLRNKIWLNECEKRPPIVVPRLPPHPEYISLTNIDGKSDPWPNGAGGEEDGSSDAGSVYTMYKAIVTWILQLKSQRPSSSSSSSSLSSKEKQFDKDIDAMYKDTWWTFYASIFIGVSTPLLSVLLGFITDELNPTTSFGTTPMEQKLYVLFFGVMTTVLYVSIVRARFYWEVKIPGYCAEHHLRWLLMRRLLETNNTPSSSSMDPGAATALLGPVTVQAVQKTIESFFEVIIIAANTVSLFISSLCLVLWPENQRCLSITIVLMVFIMLFSILTSIGIFLCYVRPLKKLERLTLRWQTRYYSLGDQQLAKAWNDDNNPHNDHATTSTRSSREDDLDDYWIAARLYRYRDFQSSIMGLSVDYFVKTTMHFFQLALIVVLAFDVIGGRLTVGRFVAVSSMSASSASYIGQLTDVLVDIPGGYCALMQIAEVMNGGGMDV